MKNKDRYVQYMPQVPIDEGFLKEHIFIFNMSKHFKRISITFWIIVENGCSSLMTKKGVTAAKG